MAKRSKASLPVASSVSYKPTKADVEMEKKWRAEEDLRTIQRAAEIQSDKSRLSAAKALAKQQVKDLEKVCK